MKKVPTDFRFQRFFKREEQTQIKNIEENQNEFLLLQKLPPKILSLVSPSKQQTIQSIKEIGFRDHNYIKSTNLARSNVRAGSAGAKREAIDTNIQTIQSPQIINKFIMKIKGQKEDYSQFQVSSGFIEEEQSHINIRIRKSFRVMMGHYSKSLSENIKGTPQEKQKVVNSYPLSSYEIEYQRKHLSFEIAMKMLHLLGAEILEFKAEFSILEDYLREVALCSNPGIIRLYENIISQFEFDQIQERNAQGEEGNQYDRYLDFKKNKSFNRKSNIQPVAYFEIVSSLSEYLLSKCKDVLLRENIRKDQIFENFISLDKAALTFNKNHIIPQTNPLAVLKERYSFIFQDFPLQLGNKNNNIIIDQINSVSRKELNQNQNNFIKYDQKNGQINNKKLKSNIQAEFNNTPKYLISQQKQKKINLNQNLQDHSNFNSEVKSEKKQIDISVDQDQHIINNIQGIERFSQKNDAYKIRSILKESFEQLNQGFDHVEDEEEIQRNGQLGGNNLSERNVEIEQNEGTNINRSLTDHIWQLVEIIKQKFYLDKGNSADTDNLNELTAYVKETFVIQIEELQDKQLSNLKQKLTQQIELLERKCKKLKVQFLQSQKIQQFLYVSKKELYEYLKVLHSQTENLREKFVLLLELKDQLTLQLKDYQLGIKNTQKQYQSINENKS